MILSGPLTWEGGEGADRASSGGTGRGDASGGSGQTNHEARAGIHMEIYMTIWHPLRRKPGTVEPGWRQPRPLRGRRCGGEDRWFDPEARGPRL